MRTRFIAMLLLLLSALVPMWSQATGEGTTTLDMRDGLSESRIRCIRQMPDGRMAIATTTTIDIFDGTRFHSIHLDPQKAMPFPNYNERSLYFDDDGNIWLRFQRTVSVVDLKHWCQVDDVSMLMKSMGLDEATVTDWPQETAPVSRDLQDRQVSCVERDSFGGTWIGTIYSGIRYENPQRLQFHTSSEPYPHQNIAVFCSPRASQFSARHAASVTNCTLDDHRDYMYIGTISGLLVVNSQDSIVARLTTEHGLANNNVSSLVRDRHGDVWAITTQGISRIHKEGRDSFEIVNFGRLDGIQLEGMEFLPNKIHIYSDGHIQAGFAGGTVSFQPEEISHVKRFAYHYPNRLYSPSSEVAGADEPLCTPSSLYIIIFIVLSVLCLLLAVATVVLLRKYKKRVFAPILPRYYVPKSSSGQPASESPPSMTEEPALSAADREFLEKVERISLEHLSEEDFSVQQLSELMAMDRSLLYRRMQSLTGVAPSAYLKNLRIQEASRLLTEGRLSISEVAYRTGFSSAKYFATVFKDATGQPPKEYRSGSRIKS